VQRFAVVFVVLLVVLVALYVNYAYISLLAGGGVGAYLFVLGQGAAVISRERGLINTRIGIALAAAGVAAASIGHNPPFPIGFRAFYWVCLVLACSAALGLAYRPKR